MLGLLLTSVIVLSLIGAASAGEDTNSANAIMPGCRALLNEQEHLGGQAHHYSEIVTLQEGVCMGTISGLYYEAFWSKNILKTAFFCIPPP